MTRPMREKSRRGDKNDSKTKYTPDKILLLFTIIMAIFGAIMIFDASVYKANTEFGDPTHFLKYQVIWLFFGGLVSFLLYHYDYRKLCKLSYPIMILTIGLLVLVLAIGEEINNARRWFSLGPLGSIQPAEFAKLSVILYAATWLSKNKYIAGMVQKEPDKAFIKACISYFLLIGIVAVLVFIEPDLGTTIVIAAIAFLLFFVAKESKQHLIYMGRLFLAIIPVGFVAAFGSEYRRKRIATYWNLMVTGEVPDARKTGYQMQQILIGIGSGGFFGTGFGQSRQRYGYLVENTAFTDSIFAVILEELGFIGGIILIGAWVLFFWRGLKVAKNAPDKQGKLLAIGITIWLPLQAFMNMAANIGLIPLTGIPLPLLTYGGSGTIVTLIGLAILLNISKYAKTDSR